MIKFELRNKHAKLPTRATPGSAGFDLFATYGFTLKPGQRHCFDTGVVADIPYGWVGLVQPRSGLALRHGIDTLAGVIDSDYRDSFGAMLINHGDKPYTVAVGDRIAQLVVVPFMGESEQVDSLDDTGRGGYGSTGV